MYPRCAGPRAGGYGGLGILVGSGDEFAQGGQGSRDLTRLSTSDASFYQLENTSTPLYVGSLSILRQPRAGLSYETLLATVEQRLPKVPRYRQKVREVTMGLARPVWIDDRDFDITYHVRRSALPSPGSDEQLHELIGRLAARPLDKSRPLWEMYLVEGLAKNRLALYTKSHQALINGVGAAEIGHVIADRNRRPPPFVEDIWIPERDPGNTRLLLGALGDWAMGPGSANAGRRQSGVAGSGNQLRATHRRRSPGLRRRAHVGARHRTQQPTQHHRVAQPAVHGRPWTA